MPSPTASSLLLLPRPDFLGAAPALREAISSHSLASPPPTDATRTYFLIALRWYSADDDTPTHPQSIRSMFGKQIHKPPAHIIATPSFVSPATLLHIAASLAPHNRAPLALLVSAINASERNTFSFDLDEEEGRERK